MAPEKLASKGQAWFCTTGLPSDVVIQVEEMSFHLHKFPLMSKSRKLHQLITHRERNPRPREGSTSREHPEEEEEEDDEEEEAEDEIEEEEAHHISLPHFPGGSETFEAAAKFCYGVKVDLTSWNVAPLRCAAEYLEMTEEFEEDNLMARTERFLAQSVLRNLKESVKALKSCEEMMPLAEDLGLVRRCIDAIAARACSADSSLFGWPIKEGGAAGSADRRAFNEVVLRNGIDTGMARRKSGPRASSAAVAAGSWFEDLTMLSLPVYKQVIAAIKERDPSSEVIEGSLVSYAKRSIPGLSRSSRIHSSAPMASEPEQRELLETVITSLPLEKTSGSLTSTRFLFGLLRTANILRASEESRSVLERKIASQLEQATLDDLLMPSYSYLVETLYDVDCVERILAHFLQELGRDERSVITTAEGEEEEEEADVGARTAPRRASRLMLVGKLVDGYLAEIASDANLRPDKFCNLALALPDHARLFDDGLYRAVDLYLKAHPGLREEERERVCGVMDCQKLTLEACTHAAQNERLPLRAVVQVLFFEQLQLRHAIAGALIAADSATAGSHSERTAEGDGPGAGGVAWRTAIRENQVMRLDMDSMRSRVHELERECSGMKKAIAASIDRSGGGGERGSKWRSSLTRRLGCKFKTQVCDSHERAVVESRRSRTEDSL